MRLTLGAFAALALAVPAALAAQRGMAFLESRDHPSIRYSAETETDPIAKLNKRLADGSLRLAFDGETGYLRSALTALGIRTESQMLVFSPTSSQAAIINPQNPRALYFNDTSAVGWVRGAEALEAAAQDPEQGVIFYKLQQTANDSPKFERTSGCLLCHLTPDTLNVPGMFVMNMHPPPVDKNAYATGGAMDHRSLLTERWGGWYVTGGPASIRHLGNGAGPDGRESSWNIPRPRMDLPSIDGLFDRRGYLTPYSDIAALMVFEHQAHMTNLLTRVGWEARVANGQLTERVRDGVVELVDYLLFVDEAPLPAPIRGSSGFADAFSSEGPQDSIGRSLHQLDLEHRLLRYPCSYMIYTEAFDRLPPVVKGAVYERMYKVLTGEEKNDRYAILTDADREAIVEILVDTKPDLPLYFR